MTGAAGGCLCGAVRFTVHADPIAARTCWCRHCQYLAGGNATVNVIFPSETLIVTGEVRWHERVADSGNVMQRGFCPQCGTPLFSMAASRPQLMVIRAGALDDPNLMAPQSTIWTASSPDWACIDADLPRIEGQPPPLA